MSRVKDKVAIVTGAGRLGNIGVAICEAFIREGARAVIATDLREDDANEVRDTFAASALEDRFHLLAHDVTSEDDWVRVVNFAVAKYGGLDVLVNNAGISVHGGIADTSLADLRRVMAVNHDALFLSAKICADALSSSINRFPGGGSIINTLSVASYMPSANNIGYHASKAAARMLTMCAALEFASKRIRVNSVHPGYTITPLVREAAESYARRGMAENADAVQGAIVAMSPLGVRSYPDETAHAFVYLASEESQFVTGISFSHDGGLAMRY